MRKFVGLFAAMALSTGCASLANSNPKVGVESFEFEKWKKGADYEMVGDTQGQACKTVVLRFIPLEPGIFAEQKAGTFESGVVGQGAAGNPLAPLMAIFGDDGGHTATTAAKYNAIEAFKGADLILPTRSKSDKIDYWGFYTRECVTVTGKAVRIKT